MLWSNDVVVCSRARGTIVFLGILGRVGEQDSDCRQTLLDCHEDHAFCILPSDRLSICSTCVPYSKGACTSCRFQSNTSLSLSKYSSHPTSSRLVGRSSSRSRCQCLVMSNPNSFNRSMRLVRTEEISISSRVYLM